MLPVGVALRRAAARALLVRSVLPTTTTLSAISRAGSCVTLQQQFRQLHAQQPRELPTTNFSTLSAPFSELEDSMTDAEHDNDEVILEPIAEDVPRTSGFADQQPLTDFELSPETVRNLERVGITHLFPVQAQSFAVMMGGADIVGRSKTGSGKTLAFALPIVEKLLAQSSSTKNPRALILLPTRELALQVSEEVKRISPQLRTIDMVGGVSYTVQENHLRRGVDILVGTPGRIMDMVNKGALNLEEVQVSVLDEADMMLKFGFQEAVETILGWIPKEGQCVMWSATFPKWVNTMSRKFLKTPVSIDLVGSNETHVPATVAHKAIHAPLRTRLDLLENVLRQHANGGQALVFTETKQEADELASVLGGQNARALHGDLSQGMRTSTMEGFRSGAVKTLICTDIAARGLDIANVELVVQYRLPNDKESFVHRAGRTGRAGRSGTNIVFFDRFDALDVLDFERRFKFTFSHTSPPHAEHVLESAMADASARLSQIPAHSAKLFDAAAEKLLASDGTSALSAALALICGFDTKRLNAVSMITGRSKTTTVQVAGVKSARDVTRVLAASTVEFHPRDVHAVDDTFVFDLPHNEVESVAALFAAEGLELSRAVELPRVLLDPSATPRSNNTGSSNGGYGGRSYGGRGGGGGGGARFGGNGGGNRWNQGGDDRRSGGSGRFADRGFGNSERRNNYDSGFSRDRDSSRPPRSSSGGGFGGKTGGTFGRVDKWKKEW
ncbi:hypothetical protein PybrP1_013195 [[Pythium] brassicae (nom. inval.)]|nr:hypothetical protein PybrP1_013195 [[Pythium] brassicae (nom. inval.)]